MRANSPLSGSGSGGDGKAESELMRMTSRCERRETVKQLRALVRERLNHGSDRISRTRKSRTGDHILAQNADSRSGIDLAMSRTPTASSFPKPDPFPSVLSVTSVVKNLFFTAHTRVSRTGPAKQTSARFSSDPRLGMAQAIDRVHGSAGGPGTLTSPRRTRRTGR